MTGEGGKACLISILAAPAADNRPLAMPEIWVLIAATKKTL